MDNYSIITPIPPSKRTHKIRTALIGVVTAIVALIVIGSATSHPSSVAERAAKATATAPVVVPKAAHPVHSPAVSATHKAVVTSCSLESAWAGSNSQVQGYFSTLESDLATTTADSGNTDLVALTSVDGPALTAISAKLMSVPASPIDGPDWSIAWTAIHSAGQLLTLGSYSSAVSQLSQGSSAMGRWTAAAKASGCES